MRIALLRLMYKTNTDTLTHPLRSVLIKKTAPPTVQIAVGTSYGAMKFKQ